MEPLAQQTPLEMRRRVSLDQQAECRLLSNVGGRLVAGAGGAGAPDWVNRRYNEFREMVCAGELTFPCYFATRAEDAGALRYTYLEQGELAQPAPLGTALRLFLETTADASTRSALIVFVRTVQDASERQSLAQYEATFWDLVGALHETDEQAWPAGAPTDPDDPLWVYCYAGEPIFITGHCPAYVERRSRHSGTDLMLVIQSRANLQGIAGHGLGPDRVRRRIRSLVSEYDDLAPSPELGVYGEPTVREWRQFWLLDSNAATERRCPAAIGRALSQLGEKTNVQVNGAGAALRAESTQAPEREGH